MPLDVSNCVLYGILTTLIIFGGTQPIMRTTIYAQPSPYEELLTTSSIGADIGITAPCNTGFARTGVLRLGNRFGSNVCKTVPTV